MPRRDGLPPRVGRLPKNPSEYKIRYTSAARRARALTKLGVTAKQVASATQITPLLKDLRGGLKAVRGAMRLSEDPVVRCFLAKHDSLGVWARENTCWEAIGLAAGIDLVHLVGAALMALREHTMTVGRTIAMSYLPEVVKKQVEYAKLPGGWRERDALFRLAGLP